MNIKKFSDCVEKLDIKYDGGGAEKIRWRDWSVDDFDAMEICTVTVFLLCGT